MAGRRRPRVYGRSSLYAVFVGAVWAALRLWTEQTLWYGIAIVGVQDLEGPISATMTRRSVPVRKLADSRTLGQPAQSRPHAHRIILLLARREAANQALAASGKTAVHKKG